MQPTTTNWKGAPTMPQAVFAATVFLLLHGLAPAYGQVAVPTPETTPPIAVSGGAEINEIHIERGKASYSAPKADLTNMQVELWLPLVWKTNAKKYLVKFESLSRIEDVTGKLLSPKDRLEAIGYMRGEVIANKTILRGGKEGPAVSFVLEAPARQATTLKSVRGKAVVSRARIVRLRFDDLAALTGKPLSDARLGGMKVVPEVKLENGDTKVTLWVPRQHGRLFAWWIVVAGRPQHLAWETGHSPIPWREL